MGRPNVILAFIDDWAPARDSWFPFAHESPRMPFLDMLRRGGVFLERFQTEMACSPTRATALTGAHSNVHGIGLALKDGDAFTLDTTLPNVLRSMSLAGYRAGVFGKWHVAQPANPADHAIACGARTFVGTEGNLDDYWTPEGWYGNGNPFDQHATDRVADAVVEFLGEQSEDPFFAWVGFHAPHQPFEAAHDGHYRPGDTELDRFLQMTEQVDSALARIWSAIPTPERENTWILVVGDNGLPKAVAPDEFRPGKGTPWEAGVRNTLTAWHALDIQTPGSSVTWFRAGVVDLFATVVDLAGVDASSVPSTSRSLAGVLRHPMANVSAQRGIVASKTSPFGADPGSWDRAQQCVVSGFHKLHREFERGTDGAVSMTSEETFIVTDDALQETAEALDAVVVERMHSMIDQQAGRPE